jgi:hypothetical protein
LQSLSANTEGNYNSAFGSSALELNTIGIENSAFGSLSLRSNTTGSYNTAFGSGALWNITTGSNNTGIGYNAAASSATANNEITLGNFSISVLRCQVTSITSLSDKRDKKNINPLEIGLDFINKLKPVVFNWDKRDNYFNGISDGSLMEKSRNIGLLAQDLDDLQNEFKADYLNLVYKSNPDKLEITSGYLLFILIKAIQELSEKIDKKTK